MRATRRRRFWLWDAPARGAAVAEVDHAASLNIIALATSNNNYPSMADVFPDLDKSGAQALLGGPLHADMTGFCHAKVPVPAKQFKVRVGYP